MNTVPSAIQHGLSVLSLFIVLNLSAVAADQAQTGGAGPDSQPVPLESMTVAVHPSGADERAAAVWVVTPDPALAPSTQISELLQGVPGVYVNRPGGPGGLQTLFLRGAEDNYTMIFLDGVPLNDPTNNRGGAVDLSLLDASLIQKAAVVRGAASVRYGPEALAGVVHFETLGTPRNQAQVVAEMGGDHHQHGTVMLDRLFTGGALQIDAAGVTDGAVSDGSRMRGQFFSGSVSRQLGTATVHASVWHTYHQADTFPDSSGGNLYAVNRALAERRDNQTAESVRVEGKARDGHWEAGISAAEIYAKGDAPGVVPGKGNPGGLPEIIDDTQFYRYQGSALYSVPVDGWILTGGADVQKERGSDKGALKYGPMTFPAGFSETRTRWGGFAEASGKISVVSLILGARGDHYDDGLTRATLRAGVLAPVGPTTLVRANAGTGFKPASFYALGNPLVGNPDLKPERSRTADMGLRQSVFDGRGILDLSLFAGRYKDGIDFDPGPPPKLVNRSEIRTDGAELALQSPLGSQVTAHGALSYVDSRSEPSGTRLASRPRWRASLGLDWQVIRTLTLSAVVTNQGDLLDNSVPTGDLILGGWTRVDFAAVWQAAPHWDIIARVENAFDRRYQEAVGFLSQGCRLEAGVRARF